MSLLSKRKFGEYIKHKRLELGMTQEELAKKINISNHMVSKWERGLAFPDFEMVCIISEVFGVSMNDMYENAKADKHNNIVMILGGLALAGIIAGGIFAISKKADNTSAITVPVIKENKAEDTGTKLQSVSGPMTEMEKWQENTNIAMQKLKEKGLVSSDIFINLGENNETANQAGTRDVYKYFEIENDEPLIVKVRDRYEQSYQPTFSYFTENGRALNFDGLWYELKGYRDYKKCTNICYEDQWDIYYEDDEIKTNFDFEFIGVQDTGVGISGYEDEMALREEIFGEERHIGENYDTEEWLSYEEGGIEYFAHINANLADNYYKKVDGAEPGACEAWVDMYCYLGKNKAVTLSFNIYSNNAAGRELVKRVFDTNYLKEIFTLEKLCVADKKTSGK